MADDQDDTNMNVTDPQVVADTSDVADNAAQNSDAPVMDEDTLVEAPEAESAEQAAEILESSVDEQTEQEPEVAASEPESTDKVTPATSENKSVDENEQKLDESDSSTQATDSETPDESTNDQGRWYVVHTYAGHENKVATGLKQRIESEHLENKIFDILVPTQDKIEIRGGKKETVKEKIFPGYILVKMDLDDISWLAVRTTQGVTSFVGMGNKPTPISNAEVKSIVQFMSQGAAPTFKDVFLVDDPVKIVDGPFSEFIGKVDSVDKEKGKVRVLVSIFGRETPVELDFLQVQKL